MRIGIVDNYDSFTYNLVHYLEEISGNMPFVCLNDQIAWSELNKCTHLLLSPGPSLPGSSGDLMEVIRKYYTSKNILGVCLGMQAIAEFFGTRLKNLSEVQHGMQSKIYIQEFDGNTLYKNLVNVIEVGRYHSWAADEFSMPNSLVVTAKDPLNDIMSIQHVQLPIYGVQYHPESIMTPEGKQILRNWLGL